MDWTIIGAFVFGGILTACANIYGWYKLAGENIDYKDYKNYLAVLFLGVSGAFLCCAVPEYIKMPTFISIQFVINYFLVSKKIEKCVSSIIIMQILLMISELIIALFASLFISDYSNLFMKIPIGICILNTGVAILLVLSMRLNLVHKLYCCLLQLFSRMKSNTLILISVATIILAITFMTMSYIQFPKSIVLLVNSILVIVYLAVVIGLMYAQEKYRKVNNKYETSLSSLKEYEDIMDQYKVDNHENKNQLLTIRNMIKAKDKTVVKYIDKLVDNKIKDNENIFYKTSKIPEGGLRATIYPKLCKMKDAGIEYSLEIANDVRTVDLIKMGDETMLNICKIIGVFLDNAIEAVEGLKEKDIIVELFVMDDNLCIEVSNNYEESIALDKISNKGYTTKGKGHGYGLSLVSKLVKEDPNLENEKEISKDLFTQRLKIKM